VRRGEKWGGGGERYGESEGGNGGGSKEGLK